MSLNEKIEATCFRPQPKVNPKDVKTLKEIFKLCCDEGSTTCDVNELQKILRPLGLEFDDVILKKFAHYNKSGYMQMTSALFVQAMEYRFNSKLLREKDCMMGFNIIDQEKKGALDYKDIKRLCETTNHENDVTEEEIQEMLTDGDKDEDGLVNETDFLFHMKSTHVLAPLQDS